MKLSSYFLFYLLLVFPLRLHSLSTTCKCLPASKDDSANELFVLKSIGLASILAAGATGVLIPIIGRSVSFLRPEHDIFFAIKSFAAGVILATALIHILPDAFDRLTSPCLPAHPWHGFPFAGFVAMMSAMGTMMVDSFATGYYRRSHFRKAQPVDDDDDVVVIGGDTEEAPANTGHLHTHGPAAAGESPAQDASMAEKIRHRVISQVLELGIVVHSVIIGISLGTSESAKIIKPLAAALSFHQFFEGVGLGGCIVQTPKSGGLGFEDCLNTPIIQWLQCENMMKKINIALFLFDSLRKQTQNVYLSSIWPLIDHIKHELVNESGMSD